MREPARAAPLLLVATLLARRERLDDFLEFERRAEVIMGRYGGELLSVVRIDLSPETAAVKEVHVVRFPDRRAFDAYRADRELAALGALRERSILSTSIRFAPELA